MGNLNRFRGSFIGQGAPLSVMREPRDLAAFRSGFSPLSIADCQLWYTPTFKPEEGLVTSGSPEVIDSVPNRGLLGGTLASAGAARPLLAHLESGGVANRCGLFDGAADYHVSSLAASAWKFLHDGTGCSLFVLVRDLNTAVANYFATSAFLIAQVGLVVQYESVNANIGVAVLNGGAAASTYRQTPINSVVAGGVYLVELHHGTASATQVELWLNGTSVSSGPYANPTSAANPTATAAIGVRADTLAAQFHNGNICEVLAYSRNLTLAERTLVRAYLSAKWQNNAQPILKGASFWFRGDLGTVVDEANLAAGQQVEVWRDVSGNAHDAVQATDADQPTLELTDINTKPGLEYDGASDVSNLNIGVSWPAGTSQFLGIAYTAVSPGRQWDYLVGANNVQVFADRGPTAETVAFYSWPTWYNLCPWTAGEQVQVWDVDASGLVVSLYRDGVLVGYSTIASSQPFAATVQLMASGSGAGFCPGTVDEVLWKNARITASDLFDLNAYLDTRYDTFPHKALRVPGHVALYEPGIGQGYTDGTGNQQLLYDLSRDLPERLTNGGFETGHPAAPTGWGAGSGATLTSEAGTRTGGAGSWVLRATIAIGDNSGNAFQVALTSGKRYRISGWGQGDGVNGFPALHSNGVDYWTGVPSAVWQYSGVRAFTASAGDFQGRVGGNALTEDYAQFDDFSVIESNDAYQATAALRPTYLADAGDGYPANDYNGTTQYMDTGVIPNASAGTFGAWIRTDVPASAEMILGVRNAVPNSCSLQVLAADTVQVGIGATVVTSVATVTRQTWALVLASYAAGVINIWINGVLETFGTGAFTTPVLPLYLGALNDNGGAPTTYFKGQIGRAFILNRAITAAEAAYLYALGRAG